MRTKWIIKKEAWKYCILKELFRVECFSIIPTCLGINLVFDDVHI